MNVFYIFPHTLPSQIALSLCAYSTVQPTMAKLPSSSSSSFLIFTLLIIIIISATTSSPSHLEGFEAEDAVDEDVSHLPLHSPPPPPTTLSTPPPPPTPTPLSTQPSFDYWDEDEFEGIPPPPTPPHSPSHSEENTGPATPEPDLNQTPTKGFGFGLGLRSCYLEIGCVLFLIMFVINYFMGKRKNENLALSWAMRFASKGSIFDKNFSLLGVGEGDGDGNLALLLKEGNTVFKFYATGRRFCQGLVATLELKSRHDLISRLYNNVVVRRKDEITVEVFMNDDAMDHLVFALARSKLAKAMHKEERDLQRYAGLVAPPSGRKWVADGLAVVAESKEVAGDLITEAVLDQVFSDKAFEKFGKFFISMHFCDQHLGSHKKMLVFKFSIPDADHMADMTQMVALIPYYVDLIGRYKLSSHARSKTEAARQKVAQEIHKELLNARQEDLKKRKAELRKKMEEAEARIGAEALRRKDAKEHTHQLKKSAPKIKMSRAH